MSGQLLNHVRLFVIPWTVASQTPLSMEFSRQEDWSGLPYPSPGDLPDPGIEPASAALAGGFFTPEPPRKPTDKRATCKYCTRFSIFVFHRGYVY